MATTKKTQKIETPIDRHETFVSIRKSFADSETSVPEKLKALYELQQTDCAMMSFIIRTFPASMGSQTELTLTA